MVCGRLTIRIGLFGEVVICTVATLWILGLNAMGEARFLWLALDARLKFLGETITGLVLCKEVRFSVLDFPVGVACGLGRFGLVGALLCMFLLLGAASLS